MSCIYSCSKILSKLKRRGISRLKVGVGNKKGKRPNVSMNAECHNCKRRGRRKEVEAVYLFVRECQ